MRSGVTRIGLRHDRGSFSFSFTTAIRLLNKKKSGLRQRKSKPRGGDFAQQPSHGYRHGDGPQRRTATRKVSARARQRRASELERVQAPALGEGGVAERLQQRHVPEVELFDRGISRGDVPRLWVDVIAHVEMGRDKRQYRFVQDTRYGRAVLAESYDVPEMTGAITRYVARRLLERDRALSDDVPFGQAATLKTVEYEQRRGRLRGLRMFVYGVVVAVAALLTWALLSAPQP